MIAELTSFDLAAAADCESISVLDRVGLASPPVDAFVLADELGLPVVWDNAQGSRARYVQVAAGRHSASRGAIVVKRDPRAERIQWAVAHEIGEHLSPRVFDRLGIDARVSPDAFRERVANQIAQRLLLPSVWFEPSGADCGWDLFDLKRCFSTASHELIARRMLDATPCVVVSVFDHGRLTWRGSNLPYRFPIAVAAEANAQLVVHHTAEAYRTQTPWGPIQAWPIHEPSWKREIVRFELDPDAAVDQEWS